VDPGRSPADHLIENEDARRVRAVLAKLPERQRRIVELRLADLSGQEIADVMNISLSAVKSAQFRAFRTLRRLLDEPDTRDRRSQP
jgi:RNA polymerase sigma factor (sigma-70 family)